MSVKIKLNLVNLLIELYNVLLPNLSKKDNTYIYQLMMSLQDREKQQFEAWSIKKTTLKKESEKKGSL